MLLLLASFFAGVLTSLAPCILPLLPVIVGSSVVGGANKKQSKWKPYIIALSLAVSVVLFTLLLKVSSLLIGIDPSVWLYVSGGIVILIGINMFFPSLWIRVSIALGFETGSNKLLGKALDRSGFGGAILTGAALGPVFSSCSPVYALVLATVLPVNLGLGIVYILAYALGLGLALLAISLVGRKLITKLKWAINPNGVFQKVLAIILVIVGLMIITGYDKKFQTWVAPYLPFDTTQLEGKLLPSNNAQIQLDTDKKTAFNIQPYDAPELNGIADWINTDPLTLAKLKGKVVLIDFWTYSCINCQRTQPYLNKWYDSYEKDGFVIIGVHAPEFAFEKISANVKKAVKDEGIRYPVALDNDFSTWTAYNNQYWPAKYLIDKDGKVRYTHFGEGDYDKTEEAIQALLEESGKSISTKVEQDNTQTGSSIGQTPETYLGYRRAERFENSNQFKAEKAISYTLADAVHSNYWSLGGRWQIDSTQAIAKGTDSHLVFNFSAKEVYLVMDGPKDATVTLTLNGKTVTATESGGDDVDINGEIHLDGARLYKLINLPTFTRNQKIDIRVPDGTIVSAFTFGG